MKKICSKGNAVLFLLALVMVFSLAFAAPWKALAADQMQFVVTEVSTKSFPETVKAFKEEVSNAGWSVLNVNNMAGVLSEKGYVLEPVLILDVCSGKYSARILANDDYRTVSVFMPCRISIYRTSDGTVHVARMNTTAFAEMMQPEVAEVMRASDSEVDEIIAKAIK